MKNKNKNKILQDTLHNYKNIILEIRINYIILLS